MPIKELDAHPELRDDPAIKDFNDLPTFVKSYKEGRSMLGTAIRPPGPDATPEARKEFLAKIEKAVPGATFFQEGNAEAETVLWSKLGRPADAQGYKAPVPDGVNLNLEALRVAAFEAGMTNKQFEKLVARTVTGLQAQSAEQTKKLEALKTEWGPAFKQKLQSAAAAAARFGQPPEVVANILSGAMDAGALKTWDAIGTAVPGEGNAPPGGPPGNQTPGAITPAEARAQFTELQSHPAYFDKNHPEHALKVARGVDLQKIINPG